MKIARIIATVFGFAVPGLVVIVIGGWGSLMLAYCGSADLVVKLAASISFALATLVALIALASRVWRWRVLGIYVVVFALLVSRFEGIAPSNDRDWQADVAQTSFATIDGDLVTVHGIRNIDYRSETDYTVRRYDERFDLHDLVGVDLIAVYWMGPAIAHTMVSFAFAGDQHLAISIETRMKRGDAYSTLKGFFRQFELYYVVADERDVIRLRTNYRRDPIEDVYVYSLKGKLDDGRRVFLEYMKRINALHVHPEFYNTLTSNCTTDIWFNTLVNADHLPFNWKILVSGYLPQYLYDAGQLDDSVPFAQLQARSHVNARALAADDATDFPARIRAP